MILNPGRPARAIAIVNIGSGLAVAAADADFDPQLSTNQFVFTVSIYTVSDAGNVSVLPTDHPHRSARLHGPAKTSISPGASPSRPRPCPPASSPPT